MLYWRFLIAILFISLLSSCERKYIEIIPILQIEKDISIPTSDAVTLFSFPTSQIGYAATDAASLMKTMDGGDTWVALTNIPATSSIKSLAFFNEDEGLAQFGFTAYRTDDGGSTWSSLGAANYVGITDDGVGILADCNGTTVRIEKSTDQGQSFSFYASQNQDPFNCGSFNLTGSILTQVEAADYVTRVWDLERDSVFFIGQDGLTLSQTSSEAYVNDVNFNGALATTEGRLMDRPQLDYSFSVSFYWHDNDFYSVDGRGDFIVAVGKKSFAVNQFYKEDSGSRWSMVMSSDGSGFNQTFHRIRFIGNSKRFYLSGDNGYLIIGKV